MVGHQIKFEIFINKLIQSNGSLIYKTNLELLRLFYNFIIDEFDDEEMADMYLTSFKSIGEINPSSIEDKFTSLILEFIENGFDYFDINDFSELQNESGIYLIFNNINNLIYVGKSRNLGSRALHSFINKMPYGATCIKFFKTEIHDIFEAVVIDYHLPMYNNKKENFDIDHRSYHKILTLIDDVIKNGQQTCPKRYDKMIKFKI